VHSRTDYKRLSDQPFGFLMYLLHHAELHESIVSNTWLLALKHARQSSPLECGLPPPVFRPLHTHSMNLPDEKLLVDHDHDSLTLLV